MEKRIVRRKVERLKSHPMQEQLFGDPTDDEIAALADDMDRNGQLQPIETTPDDVLICGHSRVKAAILLGLTTVLCWVRRDLAKQGEDAILARMIEDNLNRRHLSKLDFARSYRRLKQIEYGEHANGELSGDLRDYLARRFGVSGRTLDRWELLLDAPIEVQHAVEAGKLSLVKGGKVAQLPTADQKRIAQAIRNGERPKAVVARFLAEDSVSIERPWFRMARLLVDQLHLGQVALEDCHWETFETLYQLLDELMYEADE